MSRVSRRDFLRISATVGAVTVMAACAEPTATPVPQATTAPSVPTTVPAMPTVPAAVQPTSAPTIAAPEATAEPVSRFNEAPMLAELVAKGELPPVDERLPEDPGVIDNPDGIGKYGGRLRRGFKGVSDRWGPTKFTRRSITFFNYDLTIRPDIVSSWAISDDARTWTFKLRKGGRWSDGSFFTSADFAWYWEYVEHNTDLIPAVSSYLKTTSPDGVETEMKLSTPDDWTVVMEFADPYPLFPYSLHGNEPFAPSEYMKQWHIEFGDKDVIDAAVKEAGVETWVQLYTDKNWWYLNPDRPSLYNWPPTNKLSEEMFLQSRNPYFMFVDPEGNQMPYIDKVSHRLFSTGDVFLMWILNGEVDFQGRHIPGGPEDFTVMMEGRSGGEFHIDRGFGEGYAGMNPNHAGPDPRIRTFFQNRNVRFALSHALNRSEINELIYGGEAVISQYCPSPGTREYNPDMANVAIEYDPDLANELLDGEGYAERNSDGYRLWPDGSGEPVSFILEAISSTDLPSDQILMWISYFEDVGIRAVFKGVERSLYEEHCAANEVECGCWGGDRTHLPITNPWIYTGTMTDRPWMGAWGLWRIDPNDPNGEEPPADHFIWEIWNAYDKIVIEPNDDERQRLFRIITDVWARECPMICTCGLTKRNIIVKDGLMGYGGDGALFLGQVDDSMAHSALWWEEPEKHL